MLRNRVPDKYATWADPIYGVDLRSSIDDLQPGWAKRMSNCVFDHGLQVRQGSRLIEPATGSAWGGTTYLPVGAHRYYFTDLAGAPARERLIAIDTQIWTVTATGARTAIASSQTANKDTHFYTWSISDHVYVTNSTNVLRKRDGPNATWSDTIAGTNVPASPVMVKGYLDRLFAIQGAKVVYSNPRSDSVWAPITSVWAALDFPWSPGRPTALHLHSSRTDVGDPSSVLLVFKSSSVSGVRGSNLGDDVTAVGVPAGWDLEKFPLSPALGTESPYSIVTIPDLGTMWFTQTSKVAILPFGTSEPKIISDRIEAPFREEYGVNDTNPAKLNLVRAVYHDRKYKLFIPTCALTHNVIQFWLDLREEVVRKRGYVWSGPHTGQSLSSIWAETENGDNALYGTEGDITVGAFFYELDVANRYTDAVGRKDVPVVYDFHSYYSDLGAPSSQKYVPKLKIGHQGNANHARVTMRDLHNGVPPLDNLAIVSPSGQPFIQLKYGTGKKYGTSLKFSDVSDVTNPYRGHRMGEVWMSQTSAQEPLMDRVGLEIVRGHDSKWVVDSIIADANVRSNVPVY